MIGLITYFKNMKWKAFCMKLKLAKSLYIATKDIPRLTKYITPSIIACRLTKSWKNSKKIHTLKNYFFP